MGISTQRSAHAGQDPAAIACFTLNQAGRDYVVGDIHGCFTLLENVLRAVDFNPRADRLFSVGDLIDRGPESERALEFLHKPWFHAILGNHERLMLEADRGTDNLLNWLLNGGGWAISVDETTRSALKAAFADLPWALEVETPHGLIGIVHADVPEHMSWPEFKFALIAGDKTARETATWGRSRARGSVTSGVAGISKVICGHSISWDFSTQTVENVIFIDTGAYLSAMEKQERAGLTLLALDDLSSVSLGHRA